MARAFVIAMECEAAAVRPHLKVDDKLYVCGIGKVNAAAATMQAIKDGATEVWNAGLCGGFGEKVEVGGVYIVDKAVEYDFDLAKLNGTRVGQLNEYDTPYLPFHTLISHSSSLTLATGDHFNDREDDYDLITKELGASLRDMEGAAIAHVCLKMNVPCFSMKCVTNVAGRGSMTGQYEQNKEKCLCRLSAALKELL